jgi:hypothetical protein
VSDASELLYTCGEDSVVLLCLYIALAVPIVINMVDAFSRGRQHAPVGAMLLLLLLAMIAHYALSLATDERHTITLTDAGLVRVAVVSHARGERVRVFSKGELRCRLIEEQLCGWEDDDDCTSSFSAELMHDDQPVSPCCFRPSVDSPVEARRRCARLGVQTLPGEPHMKYR